VCPKCCSQTGTGRKRCKGINWQTGRGMILGSKKKKTKEEK